MITHHSYPLGVKIVPGLESWRQKFQFGREFCAKPKLNAGPERVYESRHRYFFGYGNLLTFFRFFFFTGTLSGRPLGDACPSISAALAGDNPECGEEAVP